jgi:phosphatidylglycerol:prolipoprotein diacylglycerol transferase
LIHISIDPDIVSIGSFIIGWHFILMFLGTAMGMLLTMRLAKKAGCPEDIIHTACVLAFIFGLIGARITHVLDDLDFYRDNPGKIIAIWEGGLGWYGCLIGGTLAVVVYAWIKKFSLARFADAAAPGVVLGLSIGRIGCTINGDAAGTLTSLPWGFVYTNPHSFAPLWFATHPAPVYEILWNMVILVLLWRLWKRLSPDGSLFLVMLAAYSFGRFWISWVRDEPAVLGPLHQSHTISLVLFVIAVGLLAYRKVRLVQPEAAAEPKETAP